MAEKKKKNILFPSFCGMVCPNFRKMGATTLRVVASALDTQLGVLEELHTSAEEFKKKFPNGVRVKGEIPTLSGGSQKSYEYRLEASAFIKEKTGMVIPVSSIIPCSLYQSVINYCIRKE